MNLFIDRAILVLSIAGLPGYSQVDGFQKVFGGLDDDGAFCIIQTFDGGFMMAGNTQSYGLNGIDDIILLKTDLNGKFEWCRTYGDSFIDNASCIRQAMDSGYFVSGRTFSYGSGNSDIFLLRTDKNGNVLFFKTYGNIGFDGVQSFEMTIDGGCILTGSTNSSGAGDQDVFLLRTDSTGTLLWAKTYGGSQFDHGTCIKILPDGNYLVGGRGSGMGTMDIFLFKTNGNGDTIWTKTYNAPAYDESYSFALSPDGGTLIAGTTTSFGAGIADILLIKTDSMGNITNTRIYGGPETEAAYSVCNTSDSGYSIVGYTESYHTIPATENPVRGSDSANVFMLRVNSILDTLWTNMYGGQSMDESFSVIQTADSGYAVAAFSKSFGNDSTKVYMIKTNKAGDSHCHQIRIAPVSGNPVYTVGSTNFSIDTALFISNSFGITNATITIIDSSLCWYDGIHFINEQSHTKIYPNPFSHATFIEFSLPIPDENIRFELFDRMGKRVSEIKIIQAKTEFNSTDLESGIYFYRISDQNHSYSTGKLALIK